MQSPNSLSVSHTQLKATFPPVLYGDNFATMSDLLSGAGFIMPALNDFELDFNSILAYNLEEFTLLCQSFVSVETGVNSYAVQSKVEHWRPYVPLGGIRDLGQIDASIWKGDSIHYYKPRSEPKLLYPDWVNANISFLNPPMDISAEIGGSLTIGFVTSIVGTVK